MATRKISEHSEATSLSLTDILIGNVSSATKKFTITTLLKVINSLAADSSPDETADKLITYDASASTVKSVLPNTLITDAKLTTTDVTTNNSSTSKHGFLPKIPNSVLYALSGKDGAWFQRVIRKTTIETVNSGGTGSTLQNDNELLFAVAANEVWQFEMTLYITAANTTMDFKCGFTVPASTTMLWGSYGGEGTQVGNTYAPTNVANSPGAQLVEGAGAGGVMTTGTIAGTTGLKINGLVVVSSTPGNVQLQWAQNTSNPSDLSVLPNSNIVLTRLA